LQDFGLLVFAPPISLRISGRRADWSGGTCGLPIGMNSRSWLKMMRSSSGRLSALMASVPLAVIRPSSQFLAGRMLTNPRSGTGRANGFAMMFMRDRPKTAAKESDLTGDCIIWPRDRLLLASNTDSLQPLIRYGHSIWVSSKHFSNRIDLPLP
jgi:hypothetical protein